MTPRERVYAAVQHQQTDIVPYQITFTSPAAEKVKRHYGVDNPSGLFCNHLATISIYDEPDWDEVRPQCFRDPYGVVWNRSIDPDIGTPEGVVVTRENLDRYEFPWAIQATRSAHLAKLAAEAPDRFRVGRIDFSLFERAWTLRGMENLLMEMVENPSFVHDLLDRITDFHLRGLASALEYDIDGIYLGDDWGQQRGQIMGPERWREFIKPRLARLYQAIHDGGKFVLIHTCGDVKALLPDLVELGVDVLNPFQPEVMDVFTTKRKYGDRLCFHGGISVQDILPHGTPEEVKATIGRMAKEIGRGGGYIMSPSHDVPADVPIENIVALIEAFEHQAERA